MPKINGPTITNRGAAGLLKKIPESVRAVLPKVEVHDPKAREGIDLIDESLMPLAVDITTIKFDPDNARVHPEKNKAAIRMSLQTYGQKKPIVVRAETMTVAAGNGTLEEALGLGWTIIAANVTPMTDEEFTGFALADNRTAELAAWDTEVVARLERLQFERGSGVIGWSEDEILALRIAEGNLSLPQPEPVKLSDRFLVPPFSVLDARQGYWQDRKRQWLALGIKSELGRGDATCPGSKNDRREGRDSSEPYRGGHAYTGSGRKANATVSGKPLGTSYNTGGPGTLGGQYKQSPSLKEGVTFGTIIDGYRKEGEETSAAQSGTSIFDPVLCELIYRWFCPPSGSIFDPFAGGSVRGVVASKLGRTYSGIDLRPEQAEANDVQAQAICPELPPKWLVGDASDTLDFVRRKELDKAFDLFFTCPPYADLELYSHDPRDLSGMGYDNFLEAYRGIIRDGCSLLKNNRFATIVVGDVRNPEGMYRNFVADTIAAFRDSGLHLYNEAILVTAVGSLPLRVGKQFSVSRKLGKTHQNVLVFMKGDPRKATEACGVVEIADLDEVVKAT